LQQGLVWSPIEEESILKNVKWKGYSPHITDFRAHYEFTTAALQECASAGDERFEKLYVTIVNAFHTAFPSAKVRFQSYSNEKVSQSERLNVDKDGSAALWKIKGEEAVAFSLKFWKEQRDVRCRNTERWVAGRTTQLF